MRKRFQNYLARVERENGALDIHVTELSKHALQHLDTARIAEDAISSVPNGERLIMWQAARTRCEATGWVAPSMQ